MAASLRVSPTPQENVPLTTEPAVAAPISQIPVHAYLARLAALHDEAAQTAHLANLLGRAPWAAAALGGSALATALVSASSTSVAPLAVWLALVAAALLTILRTYGRAIAAPFEKAALKAFAKDLSAILLYAGFAWGAGLFLVLPASVGPAGAIAFTAGIAALLAAILRARDIALCFLVPATAMGAFGALMGSGGGVAAAGILAGGLVVAAAANVLDHLSATRPQHG